MHFEILVEDASGKILLEHLVPKILGPKGRPHEHRIINIQDLKHRTMARMPRYLARTLPWDTILFQTLALQLRAYGQSLPQKNGVVIILVDLDYRDKNEFLGRLRGLFDACDPRPVGNACVAIEEGEAWILGDPSAVQNAYPMAKKYVLDSYEPDAICGTWEWLADAIFHGGSDRLTEIGYPLIGREKCRWADNIGQYMNVDANRSPSFIEFRELLRRFAVNGE